MNEIDYVVITPAMKRRLSKAMADGKDMKQELQAECDRSRRSNTNKRFTTDPEGNAQLLKVLEARKDQTPELQAFCDVLRRNPTMPFREDNPGRWVPSKT